MREIRGNRCCRRDEIRKQNQDDLLVTAEAMWVWVDAKTMLPRPIPTMMLDKFSATLHSDVN